MNINKVHAVYFSPGGTTKLCAAAVASAIGECEEHDFTSRAESLSLAASDAAVFAAPVFGGRIPGAFAGFLASVKGEDTPAVVLAVYGNRDYDEGARLQGRRGGRVHSATLDCDGDSGGQA